MRKILAFAAVAALFGSGAQASTLTFPSAAATAIPGGFQFTIDGVVVTLTAGGFADNATGNVTPGQSGAVPRIYSPGVGVNSGNDDSHTVDGSGRNDVLILTFSQPVVIDSLAFGYFDGNDDYDFFFDLNGDGVLNRVLSDIDIPNNGLSLLAGLFTQSGTWFGIGADGDDDSFKLKSISFHTVPLPAAFPLFLAGLGALGLARRRR